MQLIVNIIKPYIIKPPSEFFNDLAGLMAERRLSFCDKNQLALVPYPPNMCAVWPTRTAQGQERAEPAGMVWEWGVGMMGFAGTLPPGLTGGKEGVCCVSDWWEQACGLSIECCRKDVLLAHPALSDAWPQPSVLPLSELLIVLMNILVASRTGNSGLGVWFQGSTQWPEKEKNCQNWLNTILLLSVFSSFLIHR